MIGLDLSYTNSGVAIFRNGVWDEKNSYTFATSPKEGSRVRRAALIGTRVLDTVQQEIARVGEENTWVFIEDYAYATMANREAMGELGGIVKYMLWEQGIEWETLPIKTIRKVVVGKGNAPKALVMHGLLKRHKLDITQHDLADAAAVGLTGDKIVLSRQNVDEMGRWTKDIADAVMQYRKEVTGNE